MAGIILSTLFSFSVFANYEKLECKKGADKLSFIVGHDIGKGSRFFGLELNDHSEDAYQVFNELLASFKKCKDIASFIRIAKSEVLLCEGEMFVPNAIYGQVLMSKGAVEVLKNTIAPASGWTCK